MNRDFLAVVALAALSSFLPSVSARANIIDFDQTQACGSSPCDNFSNNKISQSYGDVAGVVDVSYFSNAGSLNWWGIGYTPLIGVAYGQFSTSITIAPLAGQAVKLNGFDMAAFVTDAGLSTVVTIEDLSGHFLGVSSTTVTHPTNFAFGLTGADGIRISWNSPSNLNVAIDNIDYSLVSVSPVPEPTTWAMMLLGFVGIGFIAYRRSRTGGPLLTAA